MDENFNIEIQKRRRFFALDVFKPSYHWRCIFPLLTLVCLRIFSFIVYIKDLLIFPSQILMDLSEERVTYLENVLHDLLLLEMSLFHAFFSTLSSISNLCAIFLALRLISFTLLFLLDFLQIFVMLFCKCFWYSFCRCS